MDCGNYNGDRSRRLVFNGQSSSNAGDWALGVANFCIFTRRGLSTYALKMALFWEIDGLCVTGRTANIYAVGNWTRGFCAQYYVYACGKPFGANVF